MAEYQKLKTENYEMLGGINTKASAYLNGTNEFRNLVNLNFATPGALTKRPGTTEYPGASIGIGATQLSLGRIYGGVSFERIDAGATSAAILVAVENGASLVPGIYNVAKGVSLLGNLYMHTGNLFGFRAFADRLFYCDGGQFGRISTRPADYDYGSRAFSLPEILTDDGQKQVPPIGITTSFVGGLADGQGLSGVYTVSVGWQNSIGAYGPESLPVTLTLDGTTANAVLVRTITGTTNFHKYLPQYVYSSSMLMYDTANIVTYLSLPDGTDRYVASAVGVTFASGNNITIDGRNALGVPANDNLVASRLNPQYMEVYNNQLFTAGFGSSSHIIPAAQAHNGLVADQLEKQSPSRAYWSEIGEPEAIKADYWAEFRTNDGDRITGMKTYAGSLIVTKERSIHRLSGSNPSDFFIQEISSEYGCLSNQAMVVWENKLWFLDSKGIAEYNGANIQIVSNKVEPIFASMNIDAARGQALAIHDKSHSEVWFAIPTGSNTYNDTIVVFDYIANAWTTYQGIQASYLWEARGSLASKRPFIGGYSGKITYLDPTSCSDAGAGITCVAESSFIAATGQTTERQYRRFYLNLDPILGVTQAITVNFRTNYGSSNVLTRTMYQAPFQSRVDFGLSAKSIQAQVIHTSASLPLKINGFAFESRYQRAT